MRKILFLLICVTLTLNSYSQDEPIKFEEIIKEDGKSTQELYPTIKAWIATSFKSAKDVIQMDDPNNGIIICKGAFDYKYPGGINYTYIAGYITYTLKIQIRDGRFKVEMEDFIHYSNSIKFNDKWSMGLITTCEKYKDKALYKVYNNAWKDIKPKCENQFKKIILGLKGATSGLSPVIDSNDNW